MVDGGFLKSKGITESRHNQLQTKCMIKTCIADDCWRTCMFVIQRILQNKNEKLI